MTKKKQGKGCWGCIGCLGLMVLLSILLPIGFMVIVYPHGPTPPKIGMVTPASEDERLRQGAEEFAAITGIKDKAERDRRIKEWMEKYPNLVANLQENIRQAATEEERNGMQANGPVMPGNKTVHVNGYTRKDGTYVAPHNRASPGMGRRR